MRNIEFTAPAYEDYLEWLSNDKKIFLKITNLIKESARTPEKGTGKPEMLKYELQGHWSRRITKAHRLVYRFTTDTITIVSCKFHYE